MMIGKDPDTEMKRLLDVLSATGKNYDVGKITKAYEYAYSNDYYGTDDAMLVEHIGYNVKMIQGSYDNIKITTEEDLHFGIQILNK